VLIRILVAASTS